MKNILTKPRKVLSWNYSFLVTLPLPWVQHHDIGKGDSISLNIDDKGNLILTPIKREKLEKRQ